MEGVYKVMVRRMARNEENNSEKRYADIGGDLPANRRDD